MNELLKSSSGGMTHRPKVTVLSSVHSVTDNRVHLREAVSLSEAGYDVTLIAVEPPAGLDIPNSPVKVITLPRRNRLRRVLQGTVQTVVEGLKTKADVYHLHDPELVWAIPVLRATGAKVVYDAHEDLPAQVRGKEYIPLAIRPLAVRFSELVVVASKLSNHVVTATEKIAERYNPGRTSVVKNYPRVAAGARTASVVQSDEDSLVYVGGISENRGAIPLVEALASDSFPEGWHLNLAGPIERDLERRLTGLEGWTKVRYDGVVSPSSARELIGRSGVGVVTFLPSDAHMDALPTKMFEYLAEGIPVIASDFPLWRTIIGEFECGILVDPGSPEDIAAAASKYAKDPKLQRTHGANARRAAVEHLHWGGQETTLLHAYEKLLA